MGQSGDGRADLAVVASCVHWMLVNDVVEVSSVYRYAWWLSSTLSAAPSSVALGSSSPLLSSLWLSVMELMALLCVEGKWHGSTVDDRVLTERELRSALHLPQLASLLPSVLSSPASSFTSPSDASLVSAVEWLQSCPPLLTLLPSVLSTVYYACYYDLVAYNVGHSSTSSLRIPSGQRPCPYSFGALLSLPLPLLLRQSALVPMHPSFRALLPAIVRQRCPFFFLPAFFPSTTHPVPLRTSGQLSEAEEPHDAKDWEGAVHQLLTAAHFNPSSLIQPSLSFPPSMRTANHTEWLAWLELLGPTFAVSIVQSLVREPDELGDHKAQRGGWSMGEVLYNPLPLLDLPLDSVTESSLAHVLFASFASILLASRTYWRALHAATRTAEGRSGGEADGPASSSGSPSDKAKKKKRSSKRDRHHSSHADECVTYLSDAVEPAVSAEAKERQVGPAFEDVEDEASQLRRESERRHKQRFPFDVDEARRGEGGRGRRGRLPLALLDDLQ